MEHLKELDSRQVLEFEEHQACQWLRNGHKKMHLKKKLSARAVWTKTYEELALNFNKMIIKLCEIPSLFENSQEKEVQIVENTKDDARCFNRNKHSFTY